MNQILRCDWLPERARWSYLAHSGPPAVPRKKNFPVLFLWVSVHKHAKKELGQYLAREKALGTRLVNNPHIQCHIEPLKVMSASFWLNTDNSYILLIVKARYLLVERGQNHILQNQRFRRTVGPPVKTKGMLVIDYSFRRSHSFWVTWPGAGRSSGIRHRNQLTAKAWEKTVQELWIIIGRSM